LSGLNAFQRQDNYSKNLEDLKSQMARFEEEFNKRLAESRLATDRYREQAAKDREQAKEREEQAAKDREQAKERDERADRDREQAAKDREQAKERDARADRDREQAAKDREQAAKDRERSERFEKLVADLLAGRNISLAQSPSTASLSDAKQSHPTPAEATLPSSVARSSSSFFSASSQSDGIAHASSAAIPVETPSAPKPDSLTAFS